MSLHPAARTQEGENSNHDSFEKPNLHIFLSAPRIWLNQEDTFILSKGCQFSKGTLSPGPERFPSVGYINLKRERKRERGLSLTTVALTLGTDVFLTTLRSLGSLALHNSARLSPQCSSHLSTSTLWLICGYWFQGVGRSWLKSAHFIAVSYLQRRTVSFASSPCHP